MSILGAVLLIVLVAVLIAADVWSTRALQRLGAQPSRAARGLRIANFVALGATLAYALYVIMTRS